MDLREFVIHPDYQSLGLGRVFMAHLASLAKDEGLRAIGFTADAGVFFIHPNIFLLTSNSLVAKTGFFAKCGYKHVGAPIMIEGDSLRLGVSIAPSFLSLIGILIQRPCHIGDQDAFGNRRWGISAD